MVTKTLKRKEVELGFVCIPAKNRVDLLGEVLATYETKLNDFPAKVDKFGRLWSAHLKQKYPVGTEVTVSKNNGAFLITTSQKIEANSIEKTDAKIVSQNENIPEITALKTLSRKVATKINTPLVEKSLLKEPVKIGNVKPFFQANSSWIFHDNILKTEAIVKDSVDLIVTSPPYNVDIKYNTHDDKISYEDYLVFSEKWITRCFTWLKRDGRFCLNIPLDKNKNGQQSVGADLTTIAKKIGFRYHSTIVWNEGNISRRTAWGSWMRASAPFVIAPVELIVILYKESWKKSSGSRISDIGRDEFMEWTNGLWTFQGESAKRTGHPAPFPTELPRRCMKLFSFVGDVVLDPFLGSGSTMVAAALNNRSGIGVDIDETYCNLAKKRLIKEAHIMEQVLA
jgi:site-specific DNA-methyltransferase (adenine-specific)